MSFLLIGLLYQHSVVCYVFQGKTLTTIALIVSNFHNGKPLPLEKCVSVIQMKIPCL